MEVSFRLNGDPMPAPKLGNILNMSHTLPAVGDVLQIDETTSYRVTGRMLLVDKEKIIVLLNKMEEY